MNYATKMTRRTVTLRSRRSWAEIWQFSPSNSNNSACHRQTELLLAGSDYIALSLYEKTSI